MFSKLFNVNAATTTIDQQTSSISSKLNALINGIEKKSHQLQFQAFYSQSEIAFQSIAFTVGIVGGSFLISEFLRHRERRKMKKMFKEHQLPELPSSKMVFGKGISATITRFWRNTLSNGQRTLVSLIGINSTTFLLSFPTKIGIQLAKYSAITPYRTIPNLLTGLFMHGSFSHLLMNMWSLFSFGDDVHRRLGRSRFIAFYISSGVVANLFSLLVRMLNHSYHSVSFGSSGAVYGVMTLFALFNPDVLTSFWMIPFIQVPAQLFLCLVLIVDCFGAFGQVTDQFQLFPHVDHLAHLGGAAFGALFYVWMTNFGKNKHLGVFGKFDASIERINNNKNNTNNNTNKTNNNQTNDPRFPGTGRTLKD